MDSELLTKIEESGLDTAMVYRVMMFEENFIKAARAHDLAVAAAESKSGEYPKYMFEAGSCAETAYLFYLGVAGKERGKFEKQNPAGLDDTDIDNLLSRIRRATGHECNEGVVYIVGKCRRFINVRNDFSDARKAEIANKQYKRDD